MPPKKSQTVAKKAKPQPKKAKSQPKKAKPAAKKAPGAAAKRSAPPKPSPKPGAKKSSAKAASTPAAPKVSTKSSVAANTSYGQWYWSMDNGAWGKYEIKQNQVMEDAYVKAGGTGVEKMSFNNWNYNIDFTNMKQHNLQTGRVRSIKREMEKASGASVQKSKESATGKRQRMVQKGQGVVDPLSGKVDSCHVHEGNGEVYMCTLNQTNVGTNNNKFYVLQLLEEDNGTGYYLFTRWGRVGVDGQMLTETFANLSAAVAAFKKKFHDKTRNDWDNKANFVKVPGKYYLMQIDYSSTAADDDDDDGGAASPSKKARTQSPTAAAATPSTLPKPVQELMKMIGNKEAMTTTMRELNIDTTRMPLGKISKDQIKKAYGYLQQIEKELKKPSPKVEEATGLFYTLIPHDFGFRRPPLINSEAMIKEKIELLDTLGQLEVASNLLTSAESVTAKKMNPLDRSYESLKCSIEPLDPSDADYKRIVEYVRNTHGSTHRGFKLEVENVFTVDRDGETGRFKKFSRLPNHQMLWHGSRLTNFMGILSQGLRIAPPEAPVTGYMFGKGIYLADVCSKSAAYCNTKGKDPSGLMLLCEAALGKPKEFTSAHYMEKPQKGFDSSKGVGSMFPDPKGAETVDGVLWPKGKMTKDASVSTALLYPEYIVYDTAQVHMRYLVKMKFKNS